MTAEPQAPDQQPDATPERWWPLAVGVAALTLAATLPSLGGLPWLPWVALPLTAIAWRWAERTEHADTIRFIAILAATLLLFLSFSWRGAFPWSFLSRTYTLILIYAVFTLGLSIQFAYCGLINFGHVASMAFGAYAVALLTGNLANHGALVDLLSFFVAMVAWASAGIGLWRRVTWPTPAKVAAILALAVPILPVVTIVWAAIVGLTSPAYIGALLTGLILAVGWAYIIGVPTLRLREDYLAIVTIAAAEILRITINNEDQWTRGSAGVNEIPFPFERLMVVGDALGQGAALNMAVAIATIVAIAIVGWILTRLVSSPWGRLVKAVGDDEDAAEGVGAPVISLKMQALALGSMVAALAGALLVWQNLSVQPKLFRPVPTFYAWAILILGGLGSLRGVVAGSAIFWVIWTAPRWMDLGRIGLEVGSQRIAALQILLVGLLLMIVVLVKPEGLFGKSEELEVME